MNGKKPSQIQRLTSKFQAFRREVIGILEEINNYLHERDVLGSERVKSEKIRKRINSLKEE